MDLNPTSSVIIGEIAGRYSPKILSFLFFKLKVNKLSPEMITILKKKEYSKMYSLLAYLWLIVFLGGSLIVTFYILPKLFFSLQKLTFAGEAIYFTSQTNFIFSILNFNGVLIIWGVITMFLFWVALGKNNREFILFGMVKSGLPYDYISVLKIFFSIALIYYVVISPFVFLSFKDYKAVYENHIVVSKFYSFNSISYNYEELNSVNVNVNTNNKDLEFSMIFNFNNGQAIDFLPVSIGTPDMSTDINNLYKKLEKEQIDLFIAFLSEDKIKYIKKNYGENKQKNYLALFKNQ